MIMITSIGVGLIKAFFQPIKGN